MPIRNITVDDSSGIFVYSDNWATDGGIGDGTVAFQYDQTFHLTTTFGANVSIAFNGSAVWIGGNKRNNHGSFSATLDGATVLGSSFSANETYQQILFSQTGLSDSEHTLVMTDTSTDSATPYLGIDFITFTVDDGDSSTIAQNTTLDDTHPSIVYSAGWSATPNEFSNEYYNHTLHTTSAAMARVEIPFTGTGRAVHSYCRNRDNEHSHPTGSEIAIYGAMNATHGPFSVWLDGVGPFTSSGNTSVFLPQTLLYYASGLANTTHNLTMVNANADTGCTLDFDFAIATQHFTTTGSSSTPSRTPTHLRPTKRGLDIGAIVGGVLGTMTLVAALTLGYYLFRKRRRGKRNVVDLLIENKSSSCLMVESPSFETIPDQPVHTSSETCRSLSSSGSKCVLGPNGLIWHGEPSGHPQPPTSESQTFGVSGPRKARRSIPMSALTMTQRDLESIASKESSPIFDAGPAILPDNRPPPQYGQVFGAEPMVEQKGHLR